MDHHFRSHSELVSSSNNSNGISTNNGINRVDNNNLLVSPNQHGARELNCPNVIEHSDSQLSLDRLFNPPDTSSSVPLRNRNLPASFFNPTWRTHGSDALNENTGINNNTSLHCRSTSYDVRRNIGQLNLHGNHMRTQSILAPMSGLLGGDTTVNQTCAISESRAPTNHGSSNNLSCMGSNADILQSPNGSASNGLNPHSNLSGMNSNNQIQSQPPPMQPLPPQRANAHFKTFSSPVFMNNLNSSSNVYPQGTTMNSSTLGAGNMKQEQPTSTMYYSDIDSNMRPEQSGSYDGQQPLANRAYQPAQSLAQQPPNARISRDYYVSGSTNDVSNVNHCGPQAQEATPLNTYFPGNDSHHQQFHITHSQPYMPFHSSLSSSSGVMNPSSSQAASSSSSNENNSILCIPTPNVHSRSCSFDGRSNNYSGQMSLGFIEPEQSQPIGGNYNQVNLSPITDQTNVFDEWNEISM